jgi:hypothetical protein
MMTHTCKRIASVSAYTDECDVELSNGEKSSGYVPANMGIGYSDGIEFEYCLDCGRIQGDFPVFPSIEE